MTLLREVAAPEQDPGGAGARARKWPWLAAALAALLIVGGVWWVSNSTSDYDDVVAELEAVREELLITRQELSAERSFITELDDELTAARDELRALDLTAREAELRARFAEAERAAMLLGYFAGADRDIVTGRAWDESWGGAVARDVAVEAIGDPALTELYWDHLDGGGGPVAEAADNEFLRRLVEHTIQPILERGAAASDDRAHGDQPDG